MSRLHFAAVLVLLLMIASTGRAAMIRPNSATATSEFSASYDVGNSRDGSGLPANFTPVSTHQAYTGVDLYWTTLERTGTQITDGSTSATYTFTTVQGLKGFYMWNHQGNAGSSRYYVTKFDLIFKDASNATIASILNLTGLDPTTAPVSQKAQTFLFDGINNVKSVQFVVRETKGHADNIPGLGTVNTATARWYTGLGEVAFETPEPASAALLAPCLLALNRRRR